MYYYHKKIQGLSPNSIEIYCKSLVDKYINPNERLNDLCLAKFVVNYDIKINKRHYKSKIIHWVSFNQHINPNIIINNYYFYSNHFKNQNSICKLIVIHGNMLIWNKNKKM